MFTLDKSQNFRICSVIDLGVYTFITYSCSCCCRNTPSCATHVAVCCRKFLSLAAPVDFINFCSWRNTPVLLLQL